MLDFVIADETKMKCVLNWLPVGLGVVFLLTLANMHKEKALRGENDFSQLYAGGMLAGSSDLYSKKANLAAIRETLGFSMETVVYTRPPFYAALLKTLALLPYRAAYTVFSLTSLGCLLWFVIRFSKECPALPLFASMNMPVLTGICGGQDAPFLLAILGSSILLTRTKKDFLAGLVFSLVAIKFHLFLFLPILFLLKRRWKILGGGATGVAALTIIGVLVTGLGSLGQYVRVLRDPWINPPATLMPNLHGLAATLHGGIALELLLIMFVVAGFAWVVWKSDNYEFLFGVTLVCGLLVSFHSGTADCIILLVVLVTILQTCFMPSLRVVSALVLTPVPYFMVMADAPYSALLPSAMLAMVGLSCVAVVAELKPATVPAEAHVA